MLCKSCRTRPATEPDPNQVGPTRPALCSACYQRQTEAARLAVRRAPVALEPPGEIDLDAEEPPLPRMIDGRTPEQLAADGDDHWPDGTPYEPPVALESLPEGKAGLEAENARLRELAARLERCTDVRVQVLLAKNDLLRDALGRILAGGHDYAALRQIAREALAKGTAGPEGTSEPQPTPAEEPL